MSENQVENRSFEQNMARLEQIVALLERGDAQLADSLALFEEGTRLVSRCSAMLDGAQQQIMKLRKGPDGQLEEVPFEEEVQQ